MILRFPANRLHTSLKLFIQSYVNKSLGKQTSTSKCILFYQREKKTL